MTRGAHEVVVASLSPFSSLEAWLASSPAPNPHKIVLCVVSLANKSHEALSIVTRDATALDCGGFSVAVHL
jgi:hypothetical protein